MHQISCIYKLQWKQCSWAARLLWHFSSITSIKHWKTRNSVSILTAECQSKHISSLTLLIHQMKWSETQTTRFTYQNCVFQTINIKTNHKHSRYMSNHNMFHRYKWMPVIFLIFQYFNVSRQKQIIFTLLVGWLASYRDRACLQIPTNQ